MELSLDAIGSARTVLIAGPTASGKSAAALALAEAAAREGRAAWIVNADAMQVYDGLRILTARPREADTARVPHRLYGHVSPGVRYSVGAWLSDVAPVLREAVASRALPIIVGGTGLYFKALTEGLAAIPDIPPEVRERWAGRLRNEGVAALHALLAKRDPASAASIRPSDPQRVLRALEVFDVTGLSMEERQKTPQLPPPVSLAESAPFVIEADRPTLHRRIEERIDRMVGEGALEEVRTLLALGLEENLPAMKAIGVREFSATIRGEMTVEAAMAKAKTETRRYAKRQDTWFRHQTRDWRRATG
jgi:tRNA dimethylallyltransferase